MIALTAIKAAMENIGEDFNKYKAYVYLVRKYLLQNLLQNFISNNMDVVEVSLHIFTPLVNKFRIFIKKEIEVFIINIFLVILNSQNSAMRHKEMVIEAFNEINKDPNFMIELFINYDCDINSRSMYEDVVRTLSRVVEGKYKVINKRKEENENGELEEIVEFLKNPDSFTALGARIPRGVLLVGPPGTGKTLLARAVAGEAGAPFLSISGSDFVEMYVGVGASRVRDLFEQAKKKAPAIVFIDEIDAVGRHRGAGTGGGNDEREQTLNQLLVEMDGFGTNSGIIVMAATNRPDVLDPALLRPGRFDRQITVNRPDAQGREDILKVHSRNKPLGPDVDLKEVAKDTIGFTGADLENLLNEAALLAVRRKKKALTMAEINDASSRVQMGTEKKSHKYSEKAKRLTAYHEAGHAVAAYYVEGHDPVKEISIIPRGLGAGGYTWYTPQEENYNSKKEMLDDLISMLGGRVAEALALGDISTGASNDLQRATQICRDMVAKYGMSEVLGPAVFSDENDEVFLGKDFGHVNNYSEATSAKIDAEIERMMRHAYSQTEEILKTHYEKLELVAETLLQKEKLTGEMFAQLMENGKLDEPEAQPTEEPEAPAAETQTAADTATVPAPEGGDTPAAEAENAPADPAPEAPKSDR